MIVVGFIGIGVTVLLALFAGIYGYGKFTQKLNGLCKSVDNHLAHDTKEIRKDIGKLQNDVTAIKTDISYLKDK